MTVWGDFDPEDAYDAGDSRPVRLAVLARWVLDISSELEESGATLRVSARASQALHLVNLVRLERSLSDLEALELIMLRLWLLELLSRM